MDEDLNRETPQYQEEPPKNSKKKIVSLIVGLFAVIILLVLFFVVILPFFQQKKTSEVTLTYWGVWDDPNIFQEIASEFTRQNPNIKIKLEKQDIKTQGKHIDRLSARIDNGTGPDLYRFHNSWTLELLPMLLPLPKDAVEQAELETKFFPVVTKDLKINGAYYGVPRHFDTLALFINNQIFQAAGITARPETWDDLASISRQLTVKDADGKILTSGVALGTYDNIAHASDIISLLLLQNGADLLDLNGQTRQNAFDALSFYTSFAKGEANIWDDSQDNSKLAFMKGNLAMYFGYSWDIFEIKTYVPNLDFTIIPVPHLSQRESTIASYWVEGVSSKTKNPKEAFEFLKFLTSRSTMEKFYSRQAKVRFFGELYPRTDTAELLKSNPLVWPFLEQGGKAESTPFSSDTYDEAMVDSLNSYLGNAIRSIINNNSSPETAVETLAAGVAQVFGRDEQKK